MGKTRDAATEAVAATDQEIAELRRYGCAEAKSLLAVIDQRDATIATLRKALPTWVPVEERLPEDLRTVLVGWVGSGHRSHAMFRAYGKWWDNWNVEPAKFNDFGPPTHWQPLPDPPAALDEKGE